MSESVRVSFAVLLTEALFRSTGMSTWIFSNFEKWPWLAPRYAWFFPLIVVLLLLAVRCFEPVRARFVLLVPAGALAGVVASVFCLFSAQLITPAERNALLSGLQLKGGVLGTLFMTTGMAVFLTLSWLYGLVAVSLASFVHRAELYLKSRSSATTGTSSSSPARTSSSGRRFP